MRDGIKAAVNLALREPQWFVDEVLGLRGKCDDWQIELLEAVADLDRIKRGEPTRYNHEGKTRFSIRSCHGTGKTTGVSILVHWYQFTHRAKIPCTAPKEKTLKTRVWPAFRGVMSRALAQYRRLIDCQATAIYWGGSRDWCALIETASRPENLAGHHPTVDVPDLLFLVEEASGVTDEIFPAIEGALSTEGAILVLISNPTRTEGEFYRSHKVPSTSALYYTMHVRPEQSRYVNPLWVEGMRRKYGEGSPLFKIRCLGDFADVEANQLVPLDWLDAAVQPRPESDGSHPRLKVSVDVADGGEDKSVITVALEYDSVTVCLAMRQFSFEAAEAPIRTADAAEMLFNLFGGVKGIDVLVVDALGVGAGTAGALMQRGHLVIAYRGGEGSDDPAQWRNRRSQSYIGLRNAFRDGTIVLAEDMLPDVMEWEELRVQMLSIRTMPGTERVEEIEPKVHLKARGVKSPDMPDSLAMLYATQTPHLVADWGAGNSGFLVAPGGGGYDG